MSEGIY